MPPFFYMQGVGVCSACHSALNELICMNSHPFYLFMNWHQTHLSMLKDIYLNPHPAPICLILSMLLMCCIQVPENSVALTK